MALLMLPRVVLTHLKAGFRAALRPDPVMIGWWTQPALPTPVKQCRPSLTNGAGGLEIALRQGRDEKSWWFPFVKHCTISATDKKHRSWVLDGINNAGFSGGPVIFGT